LVNGAAVLNAANINNGSYDNCGAVTLWASKTLFTCADIGANNVTLNVTDANNNTSGLNAIVTVIGQAPTSSIVVTPENAIYTGGRATDIYLGYGPQKLTLADNVVGTAPITYIWTAGSGLTNLSCTTCASPVFTATVAGSYTYSVTAKNQYGCTTVSTVSICVRDIRVPNSTNVYVCENGTQFARATNTLAATITPQTPQNILGPCGMTACIVAPVVLASNNSGNTTQEVVKDSKQGLTNNLSVKVLPNPTTTEFTFVVSSKVKAPVSVRMIDAAGRYVEGLSNVPIGQTFKMGGKLLSGMYFAEVIQVNERVVLKLIKEK
jgi:hypothetical protein